MGLAGENVITSKEHWHSRFQRRQPSLLRIEYLDKVSYIYSTLQSSDKKQKGHSPPGPAAGAPPVFDAVSAKSPLPPVDVFTGFDTNPSSPSMVTATIFAPSGLLSRKYAAALGLGAGHDEAGAAEVRRGRRSSEAVAMKCIFSEWARAWN